MNVITSNPLLRAWADGLIQRHTALHDVETVNVVNIDRWIDERHAVAIEWIALCDELLVELDPGSLEEFAVRAIRRQQSCIAALR